MNDSIIAMTSTMRRRTLPQEHHDSHEKDRRNKKSFDVIGQSGRGLNLAFLGGMTVIVARIHQQKDTGLFVTIVVVLVARRCHRIIPSAMFPVAASCDSIGRCFHAAAATIRPTTANENDARCTPPSFLLEQK
jgi:hypothetical protein